MSTNYEHNGEDDTLAARRTAHALGQTAGDDWAAVEAEMAASPQARQEVEASAAIAQRLKEAAETTPPAVLLPELLAAVEARLTELESAARPVVRGPVPLSRRRRLITLAVTAACLVVVGFTGVESMKFFSKGEPRQFAKSAAPPSVAVEKQAAGAAAVRDYDAAKAKFESADTRYEEAPVVAGNPHELGRNGRPSIPMPSGDSFSLFKNPVPTAPRGPARVADPNGGKPSVPSQSVNGNHDDGTNDNVTSHGVRRHAPPSDQTTFDSQSWVDNGSNGTIEGGASNLNLKIEQSQSVVEDGRDEDYSGVDRPSPNEPPIVYPDADWRKEMSHRRRERYGAAGTYAPGPTGGEGRVNPVQIETLPGLDVMVIKGSPADVATVEGSIRRVEELKSKNREASNGAGDHKTASLRGQNAVNVAGEYQGELQKMKQVESELQKKLDVQNQLPNGAPNPLSVADQEKARAELRIVEDQIVTFEHEMARLDVKSSRAKSNAKPGAKPQSKPLETWKPARVVPNASRLMVGEKEELPLKGMQVDVRVDGFRARVLLDLYYFNDRPQQLEGNFQLRLPDEAAPYFFAFGRTVYQAPQVTASDSMFFKPQQVSLGDTTPEKILALRGNSWEQPKVARMVPKEKAAIAYRDTVRRRIDPALVEWSGAGVFQCRVFPLAPQSLHRITIGYDVDLVRVGDDLELRLDLPEWQSGDLAPATVVDLNVASADARQVSLSPLSLRERARVRADGSSMDDATALTPGPSPSGRGETGRLAYRLVDPKQRPLTVRLRKPGTLMLTGNDEATGNYFATRVTLPLGEQGAGSREQGAGSDTALTPGPSPKGRGEIVDRSKQAIFLVDTSLSAGPQFPLWTKMLRATLDNNRDQIKQFAVLFFNVETFWWQEKYVDNTPENVNAVLSYADNLALEGATDLGRALQEAATPKWRKAEGGAAPDLFLLSDGAATWGEDRWALLASALTPSPSPKGRGEPLSALFAYRTGLAGGDSRLLGYLAERTGGAVFSLVGEAEIASASVAHRNRPWKLTNIEVAGGHDVLVAGRPQYVFPGQQLTVVGRLESPLGGSSLRSTPPYGQDAPFISFTLQQGSATQTIKVAMDQVITSELAGRTFGQVATNQLEDVAALTPSPSPDGRGESVEPVATSYARHFRITGRTCSLLMLESEQDYARFNIKPEEEDDFVVKQRPADQIVSKAIADTVAAMSDPKTNFLAWYNRLAASEVRFDLPASLKVYIDGLPEETFAVVPPPLVCKLRQRNDLPENLRQPWQTGMADYDALDAEAQRRLAAYGADDALRCLSSLVEERPGDAVVARDLAFTAIDWQRPGEAYHLLRRASNARTFEPITFHAMAHCLEQMANSDNHAADLAIIYYELACGGQWDQRFGDMHNIAMLDYARFLRRVAATKSVAADYAQSRLNSLAAMNLRDTADVAALIFWNTDGTDVDLHVVEPSREECFYQHTQTASGGHISRDVTTGYGPELYLLPKAPAGRYEISAHYFATDANRASTRTKVLAFIYENWGAKDERLVIKSLALNGQKEKHELGVVKR